MMRLNRLHIRRVTLAVLGCAAALASAPTPAAGNQKPEIPMTVFSLIENAERAAGDWKGLARQYATDSISTILTTPDLSDAEKARKLKILILEVSRDKHVNLDQAQRAACLEALEEIRAAVIKLKVANPDSVAIFTSCLDRIREVQIALANAAAAERPPEPVRHRDPADWGADDNEEEDQNAAWKDEQKRLEKRERERDKKRDREKEMARDRDRDQGDREELREEIIWEFVKRHSNLVIKDKRRPIKERIQEAIRMLRRVQADFPANSDVRRNLQKLENAAAR